MSNTYERSFSVSVPVDRAWRAFTDPEDLEAWVFNSWEGDATSEPAVAQGPGGPVQFELVDVREHSVLHYRQWAASPESGIDVTVVFEALEHGTRITMTQAGFGGESFLDSDDVHHGMDESLADLVLYLEHGVRIARHRDLGSSATLGVDLSPCAAGVKVRSVHPGSFGEAVGLEPGDVLFQLGRAPVFSLGEVGFFLRSHDSGDDVGVTWVRAGEMMHAHGQLTKRDLLVFANRV